MNRPEEQYEYRLENMRSALARAWDEGYRDGVSDGLDDSEGFYTNPYAKEAS